MPTFRRTKKDLAKTYGAQPLPNPLAVVFGLTLERLRLRGTEEPISSRDMAKVVGLMYGSYRLVETGTFPLRVSRSLALARKLGLDWGRVARVLAAIQVLEEVSHSEELLQQRVQELATFDEEVGRFLPFSDSFWHLIRANAPLPTIRSKPEVRQLADGLAGYLAGVNLEVNNEGTIGPPNEWRQEVRGIPPFCLESLTPVSSLIESFRGTPPPQINKGFLATFEKKNMSRVRRHYAVLRHPGILDYINREQPEFSSWPFLLCPQFEFLGIVVAFQKSREQGILKKFKSGIKRNWRRTFPEVTAKEADRILDRAVRVKVLREGDTLHGFLKYNWTEGQKAPDSLPAKNTVELNNVWLYSLGNPANTVAFVDTFNPYAQVSPLFATSCSWEFTAELARELDTFWKTERARQP